MSLTDIGFGTRLQEAIKDEPSVNAFAKRAGVGESSIRNYLKGNIPGADTALKIADTAGVSIEWLLANRGPMRRGAASDFDLKGDLTLIERLDIQAAAGNGMYIDTEQSLDYLAFQTTWLRRKGINPNFARLLNIKGDSMEPTIRDGDIALVDTSITEIIDNAIYVLLVGNRLLIKRIHVMVSGAFRLISDNPIYPAEEIAAKETDLVRVSGRVVWYGRTI